MKANGHRSRLRKFSRFGIILLLLIVAVWLVARRDHSSPNELAQRSNEPPQKESRPSTALPTSPSPNVTNPSAIAARFQASASTVTGRVDRETMLRQLKRWVRKREGYDVEIVTAQDVLDLHGNPASLNVIVTSQLNGQLTAQDLKVQLDEAIEKERGLREQLAKAHREEDIASVNRLVAELVESRTAFVTNNGVSSYKLSLVKDLPPVLAFWPGMPFETVREGSARALAETKLGPEIGLHGLVHFTSATALLQFTNRAGASVYIDPFRMTEISLATLQALSQGRIQRDDEGRDSRIATQWADYLAQ